MSKDSLNNLDFERVVSDNYRNVYSLAYRLTRNGCDAEDITQEVFMKLYKSQSSFRGDSKLETLLYRITYNHTVDFLRRRKPRGCELREEAIADEAEDSTKEEKMAILERAIAELPILERTIITLFYMEGKSIEEISKIVELSIANIKVKLHRTRKRLYTTIGEEYYE